MHLVESESELRQIGQLTLEMQNTKDEKGKKRKEKKEERRESANWLAVQSPLLKGMNEFNLNQYF